MNRIFLAATLFIITFTSCRFVTDKRIHGNGVMKSETRSVGSFNSVDVSGGLNVFVKQDSVVSVKIEGDENLLEYVQLRVDGGTLTIREEEGFNLRSMTGIKIYVSGPSFKHFEASGASDIYSENKISCGHAVAQFAIQFETDDIGQQHIHWLTEHHRLRLNATYAPAHHAKTVDHGSM